MFIYVYTCLTTFTRFPMFTTVYLCISTHVYSCLAMFTPVDLCLPLFTLVYLRKNETQPSKKLTLAIQRAWIKAQDN